MKTISMNNVHKAFGDNQVLKGVTLGVNSGEIFGLLGPSGSGKTTIINILIRQLTADSGETFTDAESHEIGLMLEQDGLFNRLSVMDNMVVFETIYGLPRARTIEALEKVGLGDAQKTIVDKLSKGMRQRLVLARAVLHKPKILFLDEPTSALDPLTARGIYQLIRQLRDEGSTILLTTHNMEEATHLCDRVVLLHGGKIIEEGDPHEICKKYDAHKTLPDLEGVFVQLTGGKLQ